MNILKPLEAEERERERERERVCITYGQNIQIHWYLKISMLISNAITLEIG